MRTEDQLRTTLVDLADRPHETDDLYDAIIRRTPEARPAAPDGTRPCRGGRADRGGDRGTDLYGEPHRRTG